MPDRREREPDEHQAQAAPASCAGAIGRHARPRHEHQQQDVVDGHHRADGGAVIAERVPDEERHEGAEERAGDSVKQSPEAHQHADEIGNPPLAGRRCRGDRTA